MLTLLWLPLLAKKGRLCLTPWCEETESEEWVKEMTGFPPVCIRPFLLSTSPEKMECSEMLQLFV